VGGSGVTEGRGVVEADKVVLEPQQNTGSPRRFQLKVEKGLGRESR